MHPATKYWKFLPAFALSLFLLPSVTQAQHYTQKNLVSDVSQPNNADGTKVLVDPNLKNPWGLTRNTGSSPWWVANNNSGTSTLYDGNGNPFPPPANGGPLVVTVPPPNGSPAVTSRLPQVSCSMAAPRIFWLLPANPLTSSLPRKMGPSPAGTADRTLSSSSITPITAPRMALSTKAQPPAKSTATNFFTSPISARHASKSTTQISSPCALEKRRSKPRKFPTASRRSIFKTLVALSSLPTRSRTPPGTMTSPVTASVSLKSSRPPASTSGTSSMARGSTRLGASCGPLAISASSAMRFSSAISAAAASPPSTASPTNSWAS